MQVTLTDFVNQVLPWTLEIKIGDVVHSVRPPTVADADRLMNYRQGAGGRDAIELLAVFFDDPKPDFASLTVPELSAIGALINARLRGVVSKKNLESLAAAAEAMMASGRSGSSSSRSGESSVGSAT